MCLSHAKSRYFTILQKCDDKHINTLSSSEVKRTKVFKLLYRFYWLESCYRVNITPDSLGPTVISLLFSGFYKYKERKGLTTITTKERQQEDVEYLDPYSIFKYPMNSPVIRDRYTTRLDRFFSFIGIEGIDVEERCRVFVQNARKDDSWAFRSIINFLLVQKERINRKEITGSTVRNYVKAIKLCLIFAW